MNFETIVERYSKLAYTVAIDVISSPEDAQDIVQESYLKLYSHFNEYKKLSEKELKNILCKIVLNKCRDYLKSSKQKEKNILDDISNLEEFNSNNDNLEEILKNDRNNHIVKSIETLKEPYKQLIKMYYIYGYSLEEIANKRNTSKGTIKVQITRGKSLLKEKLGKEQIYL